MKNEAFEHDHRRLEQALEAENALSGLATGEPAMTALRQWIDRYDVECMRCTE